MAKDEAPKGVTFELLADLTDKAVRDKLMAEADRVARRSYAQRLRALQRRRSADRIHASV